MRITVTSMAAVVLTFGAAGCSIGDGLAAHWDGADGRERAAMCAAYRRDGAETYRSNVTGDWPPDARHPTADAIRVFMDDGRCHEEG